MARRESRRYIIDLTGRIVSVGLDHTLTNPNATIFPSKRAANEALQARLRAADDEELSYG